MAELIFLSGFFVLLGIGGIIADYIFPHIKPLTRYIDRLPMMDEEAEFADETDILLWEEAL